MSRILKVGLSASEQCFGCFFLDSMVAARRHCFLAHCWFYLISFEGDDGEIPALALAKPTSQPLQDVGHKLSLISIPGGK